MAKGVLVALLVAWCACGGKPDYPGCKGQVDCKPGEVCVQKRCLSCTEDPDCPAGKSCRQGQCVVVGACRANSDCPGGHLCLGGRCTQCRENRQCGTSARCQDGLCVARGLCTVHEDCSDDEDCIRGLCQRLGRTANPPTNCALEAVYFDYDSAVLEPKTKNALRKIADCLRTNKGRVVFVEGHTDPRGTEQYNIALSESRAQTVTTYLLRLGVDPKQLRVIPRGETLATGTKESDWNRDRRVQFEWQ